MTEDERDHYFMTYGIKYIKTDEDDKYECGYYKALNTKEEVIIPYKFRKKLNDTSNKV